MGEGVLPDLELPKVVNIFICRRQISVKAAQISNLVVIKIAELTHLVLAKICFILKCENYVLG